MSAPSPRPWRLQADEIRDANGELVAQVAEGGGVIWNTDLEDETARANARVLVAAPGLFEALEELAPMAEEYTDRHYDAGPGDGLRFQWEAEHRRRYAAVAKARAALKKARGA